MVCLLYNKSQLLWNCHAPALRAAIIMNSVAWTMKSLSSRIKHWDGGDGRYKRIWFFFAFNMQIWLGEKLLQLTADIHRQSYKCLRQRCVAWIEVFDLNELDLHICVTFFIFYAGERWRINHRLWKKKTEIEMELESSVCSSNDAYTNARNNNWSAISPSIVSRKTMLHKHSMTFNVAFWMYLCQPTQYTLL